MSNLTEAEQTRFNSKWTAVGDCHVWTEKTDRDGYGSFYLRRKTRRAHRVAWFALHGPVPTGMVINHVCRNRSCVNVQHLGVITPRDNSLRDSTSVGYVNSQKTVCKRGHLFDRTYTNRTNGKTQRYCSTCESAKARRLRAKWYAEDTLNV